MAAEALREKMSVLKYTIESLEKELQVRQEQINAQQQLIAEGRQALLEVGFASCCPFSEHLFHVSLNFVVLPFPVGVSSHLTAIKTLSFAVTRVVADVRVTNADSFWSAVA